MSSSRRFQTPPPSFLLPRVSSPTTRSGDLTVRLAEQRDDLAGLKARIKAKLKNIERWKDNIINIPVVPDPEKIPTHLKDRPLDPIGPADSNIAIIFQNSFEHQGYAGLAAALRQIAARYQEDSNLAHGKHYDPIINKKNELPLMNILMTMHPDFLTHMLRGDLAWQYCNDEDFYLSVNAYHSLKKTPGTYVQILARTEAELDTPSTRLRQTTLGPWAKKNPDAGAFLTAREINELYNITRNYLRRSNNDLNQVKDIDRAYPGWTAPPEPFYSVGGRRYITEGNRGKLERWMKTMKGHYIDRIEPLLAAEQKSGVYDRTLDVPFRSAPFEIGYGTDVRQRANAHDAHGSSNSLWTFLLAVVKYRFDPTESNFVVYRFQTNYIAPKDIKDAYELGRISDIAQTMLGRGEWHQGGLNPVPGGGGGVNENKLLERRKWLEENFDSVYKDKSIFTSNLARGHDINDQLVNHRQLSAALDQIEVDVDKRTDDLLGEMDKNEIKLKEYLMATNTLKLREVVGKYRKATAEDTGEVENREMYD